MKKNVASQVVAAQLVDASDGSAVTTGTTTVHVLKDGGTQGTGSGTVTHEGEGCWSYVPTQAETDADHVAFTFTNSAAIPTTVQVYTTFPQTGDNFARLGAPAGASVSADVAAVKVDTAAILVDTGTSGVLVSAGTGAGQVALASGAVTVGTNGDKTGYSLSQAFPTNFADLAISATTGRVTVGAVGGDAVTGAADLMADVSNLDAAVSSRLAAAAVPANFEDLAISVTTGRVTVGAVGGDAVTGADDLKADVSALTVDLNADQSGVTVGTVSAVTSLASGAITAASLASAAGTKIADIVLRRGFAAAAASGDGDSKSFRSLLGAVAKLVNKVSISATTLTVTEADDTTALGTQAVTTDAAAEPITGVDTT